MESARTFLSSSTVHGFRYLVGNGGVLEKLAWLCTLVGAFSISFLLGLASVREASQNPVYTTVENVPIEEVPFPAITVEAKPVHFLFGFMQDVFNNLEFDCLISDRPAECQSRSSKLRDDIKGLVERAMRSIFDIDGEVNVMKPCFNDVLSLMDNELVRNITRSFMEDMPAGTVDNLKALSGELFRMPQHTIMNLLQKFAEDFDVSENVTFGPFDYRDDCRYYATKLAVEVQEALSNFLRTTGNKESPLGLGSLLHYMEESFDLRHADDDPKSNEFLDRFLASIDSLSDDTPGVLTGDVLNFLWLMDRELLRKFAPPRAAYDCDFRFLKNVANESTICDSNQTHECCLMKKALTKNYELVLKVGKYWLQPAGSQVEQLGIINDQNNVLDKHFSEYSRVANRKGILRHSPAVLSCKFGKKKTLAESFGCTEFDRMFATTGIAYTFNGPTFWEMYQHSNSTEIFYEQIHSSVLHKPNMTPYQPLKFLGRGSKFGFQAFVYTATPLYGSGLEFSTGSRLQVHAPSTVPDLRTDSIPLLAYYSYFINVNPTIMQTDPDVLSLSPDIRGCKTADEIEGMLLFKKYTQANCLYECALKQAYHQCECIPWNYPRFETSQVLCSGKIGKKCFEQVLAKDDVTITDCKCPIECDSITYDIRMERDGMVQANCYEENILGDSDMRPFMLNEFFLSEEDKHSSYSHGTYTAKDACISQIMKLSQVVVYSGSNQATRIRRSRRVSLANQLADLGNIDV